MEENPNAYQSFRDQLSSIHPPSRSMELLSDVTIQKPTGEMQVVAQLSAPMITEGFKMVEAVCTSSSDQKEWNCHTKHERDYILYNNKPVETYNLGYSDAVSTLDSYRKLTIEQITSSQGKLSQFPLWAFSCIQSVSSVHKEIRVGLGPAGDGKSLVLMLKREECKSEDCGLIIDGYVIL